MEVYAREEGGAEELLACAGCGSSRLEPAPGSGATGAPSWGLMTRFSARCAGCGRETHRSWPGRVRFRFVREESGAARAT